MVADDPAPGLDGEGRAQVREAQGILAALGLLEEHHPTVALVHAEVRDLHQAAFISSAAMNRSSRALMWGLASEAA